MVRKGSSATTNITRSFFWICHELETVSLEEVIMNPGLLSFLNTTKILTRFTQVHLFSVPSVPSVPWRTTSRTNVVRQTLLFQNRYITRACIHLCKH